MTDDPREAAERYRQQQWQREQGLDDESAEGSGSERGPAARPATRSTTAADRAAYVETAIQQAIRRGEFDDLPGAGKPLEGLGETHDADWWLRRKIETEQLRGLGPPALTLRVEHAELESRLDALTDERDVREYLEDFNRRVIEARRQLLGGPPVVTPTRDVEVELAAWAERRVARRAAETEAAGTETAPAARRYRWLPRCR